MAEHLTTARRRRGRHRKTPARQSYSWLGPAALTLGVGTALFSGTAVAHADDADSSASSPAGSDTETATSPQAGASAATVRVRGTRVSRHADAAPTLSPASTASSERTRGGLPVAALIPAVKQQSPADVPASTPAPDVPSAVVSVPDTATPSAAVAVRVPAPVQASASPVVDAAAVPAAATEPAVVAADPIVPQPVTAPASTVAAAVPGSVTAVDAALTPGGDPLAPAGQAVSAVVLAAARRELGAAPAAATPAPVAAVTVSAPPTPAPAAAVAVPKPAASGSARGTARVQILVNVRNAPSTAGPIVAQYSPGMTFNYDSYVDANGYRWLSYISGSGVRRYVAQQTLDGKTVYVSGGVPLAAPAPPPPPPPPPPSTQVKRTKGLTRSSNPGIAGYCTWGAAQKWYEATGYYPALSGNATDWDNSARANGWTVVLDAQPRSIVVFESSLVGGVGHVAWVNSVNGKQINITEMNYGSGASAANNWKTVNFNKWNTRTITDVPGMSYILAP